MQLSPAKVRVCLPRCTIHDSRVQEIFTEKGRTIQVCARPGKKRVINAIHMCKTNSRNRSWEESLCAFWRNGWRPHCPGQRTPQYPQEVGLGPASRLIFPSSRKKSAVSKASLWSYITNYNLLNIFGEESSIAEVNVHLVTTATATMHVDQN